MLQADKVWRGPKRRERGSHSRCVESKARRKGNFARTRWWEGRQDLFSNQKICVLYPESYVVLV